MIKALVGTSALVMTGVVTLTLLAQSGRKDDSGAQKLPEPRVDLSPSKGENMGTQTAVFAGGCFWCVEAVFEPLQGVEDVVSGYAGGSADDAQYDLVSAGRTDHAEAVEITYDPTQITYGKLLQVFFNTHDPLTAKGQHPDYGRQYRPAVFYAEAEEKRVAETYLEQLEESGVFEKPIQTALEPLEEFYPAEEYHQDFVERNPEHAYVMRWSVPKTEKVRKLYPELLSDDRAPSSRPTTQPSDRSDGMIEKISKSENEWRKELTSEQFRVLREEGTERAFSSSLNKVKEPGTFACAACGLPLFETKTKFDSGTGWPSFSAPVDGTHVHEVVDNSHGMTRTEVECARCGGHLGHVFEDGPAPTGLRYCINGVSLEFEAEEGTEGQRDRGTKGQSDSSAAGPAGP